MVRVRSQVQSGGDGDSPHRRRPRQPDPQPEEEEEMDEGEMHEHVVPEADSFATRAKRMEKVQTMNTQLEEMASKPNQNFDETTIGETANALTEADENFKKISEAGDGRELNQDATTILAAGRLILNQISALNISNAEKRMNTQLYAHKLKLFARAGLVDDGDDDVIDMFGPAPAANPLMVDDDPAEDEEERVHEPPPDYKGLRKIEWAYIGRRVGRFLNIAPTVDYLRPIVKTDAVAPRDLKVKRERAKKDEKEDKLVMNSKNAAEAAAGGDESFTLEVDHVRKCLKRAFKSSAGQPLSFYKFIINPDSFSRTVENMFHVSFLIWDGVIKVRLGDDGLPVMVQLSDEEKDRFGLDNRTSWNKNQMILPLSHSMWMESKTLLNIDQPAIPLRKK